jgi:hypothetical protein
MARRFASRNRMASVIVLFALTALVLAAGPANAQAIIKVSDTVNVKFGLLLQPQAEWIQIANSTNTDTAGYQQNLFIRRIRIMMGGQVAKNVFFFAETENSTLGKSTSVPPAASNKSLGTGFQMLDAVVEWRLAKEFNLQGGLIRVPTSREALKGSTSELPLDLSAWTFLQSTPEQSTAGRDTGFMARGYFINDHLEYRVGGFQGFRVSGSRNKLRFTSRLQYNFFDTEVYNMPSYVANFLGAKKILNIGGAADLQDDYKSYSADAFASLPVSSGSVDGSLAFQSIDGGTFLPTALPKQQTYQAELLYYSKAASLAPWIRWERRDFTNVTVDRTTGDSRYSVGLTYLVSKNNVMVKTGYTRIDPKTGAGSNRPGINQFGVLLHLYYN